MPQAGKHTLPQPVRPGPETGSMAAASRAQGSSSAKSRAITLLPSQLVLLDCPYAEAHFGDPFMLVAAAHLEGYKGIRRSLLAPGVQSYMLAFARERDHPCGWLCLAVMPCDGTAKATDQSHRLPAPDIRASDGFSALGPDASRGCRSTRPGLRKSMAFSVPHCKGRSSATCCIEKKSWPALVHAPLRAHPRPEKAMISWLVNLVLTSEASDDTP